MHNYLVKEPVISFQIPIALPNGVISKVNDTDDVVARPIDLNDVPAGILHVGQLKGRVLPVAAAKFLDSVITELRKDYGFDLDQ